jgi:hypothetical protein
MADITPSMAARRHAIDVVMIGARLLAGLGWVAAAAFCLLWLAHQGRTDRIAPKFAETPYEDFSRRAAAAIALREWHLFGDRTDTSRGDSPERNEGLWQRVGEYWWVGVGADSPSRAWTGKHDENGRVFPPEHSDAYAWSAAFISYVMRIAGAGRRFPYSGAHFDFIAAGRGAASDATGIVKAMRPEFYAPRLGDLVCFSRERNKVAKFDDITRKPFRAHCAIVVEVKSGAVLVIGGNVGNAVAMSRVPTTPEGLIARADGRSVDDRYPWLVVLAVPYDS